MGYLAKSVQLCQGHWRQKPLGAGRICESLEHQRARFSTNCIESHRKKPGSDYYPMHSKTANFMEIFLGLC